VDIGEVHKAHPLLHLTTGRRGRRRAPERDDRGAGHSLPRDNGGLSPHGQMHPLSPRMSIAAL
jgi:hypothetical protein